MFTPYEDDSYWRQKLLEKHPARRRRNSPGLTIEERGVETVSGENLAVNAGNLLFHLQRRIAYKVESLKVTGPKVPRGAVVSLRPPRISVSTDL